MEEQQLTPDYTCYTPSLPFTRHSHRFGKIHTRATSVGFYAEVFLENVGWKIQHYGNTPADAKKNLIDYIVSGRFDADRLR